MKNTFNALFIIAFIALISIPILGQEERIVVVEGFEPGVSNGSVDDFNDLLFSAITSDSTKRKENPNTVYLLKRNHIYPLGSLIENYGYHLHIRGEQGEGRLPEIIPCKNIIGDFSSVYIRTRDDFTMENVQVNGFRPDGYFTTRSIRFYGVDSRVVIKNCVYYGDRGAGFTFIGDSISAFIYDCIVQNAGHHKSVGGNGRFVDLRNKYMDTIVIKNSTFTYASDRIIRNMGTKVNYLEIDHFTALNSAGFNGAIQLGSVHTAKITNSIFANTISLGHEDDRVIEQTQPEKHFAVITLDNSFEGQVLEIRNNNIYTDQAIKNVWDKYSQVEAPWILTPTLEIALEDKLSDAYTEEPLAFASSCGNFDAFVDAYYTNPDATEFPENWCIGGDGNTGLFPNEVDLSYGTLAKSYTAGDGGYPLGNLNYYPELRSLWETNDLLPPADDTQTIYYCKNETTQPLEADNIQPGASIKWYSDLNSPGILTPPTPSSASVDTSNYFFTETIDGVEIDTTKIVVIVYEPEITVRDQVSVCGDVTSLAASFTNYKGYDSISYKWSYDDINLTEKNPNVIFKQPTTVSINLSTPSGCSATSSFNVTLTKLNQHLDIIKVSVNGHTGTNTISWDAVNNNTIDSIYVIKTNSLVNSEIQTVGAFDYSIQSNFFEDTIVYENPSVYKYSIITKDICGFLSDTPSIENFDRGIGLNALMLTNESKFLEWNSYIGRPVVKYQIMRGTSTHNLSVIFEKFDQNSYSDTAFSDTLYYQVRANLAPEYSDPEANYAMSNILKIEPSNKTSVSDVDFTSVRMFPNPTKDYLNIDIQAKRDTRNYQLKIVNSIGITVFHCILDQEYYTFNLDDFGGPGLFSVQLLDVSGSINRTRIIILQ